MLILVASRNIGRTGVEPDAVVLFYLLPPFVKSLVADLIELPPQVGHVKWLDDRLESARCDALVENLNCMVPAHTPERTAAADENHRCLLRCRHAGRLVSSRLAT